jgi:hypothetical protein
MSGSDPTALLALLREALDTGDVARAQMLLDGFDAAVASGPLDAAVFAQLIAAIGEVEQVARAQLLALSEELAHAGASRRASHRYETVSRR